MHRIRRQRHSGTSGTPSNHAGAPLSPAREDARIDEHELGKPFAAFIEQSQPCGDISSSPLIPASMARRPRLVMTVGVTHARSISIRSASRRGLIHSSTQEPLTCTR